MTPAKWVVVTASLILLIGVDDARVQAQAPADTQLFSDALAAVDVASAAQVIRERFVTPRFDLFEPGVIGPPANRRDRRLVLNLFPDTTFTAALDRVTLESREAFVWVGHLEGGVAGMVTLALRGQVMAGEVRTATALYEIRFAGGDAHVIRQVDPASYPPDGEPLEAAVDAAALARAESMPLADDGSIVDVMVVYTPSASAAAGGPDAIQALIDLAIANANTSYANSGVIQRLRLVHKAETAYVETDFNTDLNRLTGTGDGFMDSVHALRDTFRADLVALVINDTAGALCGLAWVMNVNSTAFATNGFSANHFSCIAGNLTLAHEMGHNMSLNHDTVTPPGPFPYTYGRGYNSGTRRDIMAVASAQPRMQNFSNPAANFVGTAEPSGTADRNAALALNNTRMTVANFRPETFDLTVNKTNGGSSLVSSNPSGIACEPTCTFTYPYNTVVTLTASPALGWTHGTWGGACSGTTAQPCVVTMTQARSVTATFTSGATFQLTVNKTNGGASLVSSNPSGIACGPTCTFSYPSNTVVTLTASPALGWTHGTWGGACSGTTAQPCVVTMTQARSVTATFTGATFQLTVNKTNGGSSLVSSNPSGIACGPTCTFTYPYNTLVTLTASPAPGWSHGSWGGACSGTTAQPCVVTMSQTRMVAASFTAPTRLPSDLDGDGIADILLQHSTSWVGAWRMNQSGSPVEFMPIAFYDIGTWKAVDRADLNGDGIGDVILQHSNSWVGAWMMSSTGQPTSFVPVAFADNGEWKVVGAADINGDAIGDIILQHSNSWVAAWIMDGTGQPASFVPIVFADNGSWQVVAVGDLNGDGISDILLQHATLSWIGAWLMNGAGSPSSFVPVAFGDTGGWKGVGVSDVNRDGVNDILLQHAGSGVGAWLRNAAGEIIGFLPIAPSIGGWQVVGRN